MRHSAVSLLVCVCVLFASNVKADGSSLWESAYVRVSGGGNWTDDLRSPSVRYDLDPGYGVFAAPGVQVHKYAAFEAEVGFLWNNITQRTTAAGGSVDVDGEFWRVPMMVNVIAQLPAGKFLSYVGFGGGWMYQDLNVSAPGLDASDSRFDSAFQGFVGVDYKVSETVSVGAGYKYLRTVISDPWVIFGPIPEKPKAHGSHSISAVVRVVF